MIASTYHIKKWEEQVLLSQYQPNYAFPQLVCQTWKFKWCTVYQTIFFAMVIFKRKFNNVQMNDGIPLAA